MDLEYLPFRILLGIAAVGLAAHQLWILIRTDDRSPAVWFTGICASLAGGCLILATVLVETALLNAGTILFVLALLGAWGVRNEREAADE